MKTHKGFVRYFLGLAFERSRLSRAGCVHCRRGRTPDIIFHEDLNIPFPEKRKRLSSRLCASNTGQVDRPTGTRRRQRRRQTQQQQERRQQKSKRRNNSSGRAAALLPLIGNGSTGTRGNKELSTLYLSCLEGCPQAEKRAVLLRQIRCVAQGDSRIAHVSSAHFETSTPDSRLRTMKLRGRGGRIPM